MKGSVPPELEGIWEEARAQRLRGELEKAVETYKYTLIMYGDYPEAREKANAYLGDVYLTLRKLDLAETHIKKAIEHDRQNAAYHYILGFVYSKKRHWGKSIREFQKSINTEPSHGEYHRGLGWAVYSKGDTLTGLSILHTAHDLDPDNVNTLTDMAVAYSGMADFTNARKYIKMALDLEPDNQFVVGAAWNIDYLQHQCHLDEDE